MDTDVTSQQSLTISSDKLMALVRGMLGTNSGREDDDHPLPPGPWDPIIRTALEKSGLYGPQPDPWKMVFASILARHPEIWDVVGGGLSFNPGEKVSLNPQPLPPRYAFLLSMAQAVTSRAELLQEIGDAAVRDDGQRGIIIVSGYIARFVDDFCGTGFKLRFPFPGPRPHWFSDELSGLDLVVMATHFDQAAKEAFSPELSQSLSAASAKLAEAGMSRM